MIRLTSDDTVVFFLAMGILLALARAMGEIARRVHQPVVLGEILAGILLGPTVLGTLAPRVHERLFPATGGSAMAFSALTTVAVVLFLLVAGMEVNLSSIWRQGRSALFVSISGIVFPFLLGLLAAFAAPAALGCEEPGRQVVFAFFFATALSISALPVIAKTLMDLNLYRSDVGMVVIASAIFDDLVGWIIFAVIIGLLGGPTDHHLGIQATIVLTLAYAGGMLTLGRRLIHAALPWVQAHTAWPGGVLSFCLALAMLGAAFTQWVGVHAIFGSFMVGVAIGDSPRLRGETRATISQFVSFVFAPLFFASIGLQVNLLADFDPVLTALVFAIACAGKVLGCGMGGRLGGMAPREAWAVGFSMNARGVMGIILGLLGLQNRLIHPPMFVALVIMSVLTSMLAGPAVRAVLRLKRPRRFTTHVPPGGFVPSLASTGKSELIVELCNAVCPRAGLDPAKVAAAVLQREAIMPTGIGKGIAVPHARLEGLARPVVGIGVSHPGVDFDAPDGEAAHIICLILTPPTDDGAQVEILADLARTFQHENVRVGIYQAAGHTDFLAVMNTQAP
jgi:Kef-type K+ transport system membrane component KefB/mannitol/fructose-specific phosphotransferase system IIA component (Ntr-type)